MNPENIQMYLSFLAPCVTLLLTTVVFLQKFVKNKKLKKILEKTEKITKEIIPYISDAEKLSHFSGEEKKEYVMTKLNKFAIENKIDFNEELTSQRIEELISLTKEVNCKNKEESSLSAEERMRKIMEGLGNQYESKK